MSKGTRLSDTDRYEEWQQAREENARTWQNIQQKRRRFETIRSGVSLPTAQPETSKPKLTKPISVDKLTQLGVENLKLINELRRMKAEEGTIVRIQPTRSFTPAYQPSKLTVEKEDDELRDFLAEIDDLVDSDENDISNGSISGSGLSYKSYRNPSERLKLLVAARESGNDSPKLAEEGIDLADYMLERKIINLKQHKELFNFFF